MTDSFIGEIRLFPYPTTIPKNWLACDGQTMAIAQNQALYALLGVTYGGDGRVNFKLPDLRGRNVPGAFQGGVSRFAGSPMTQGTPVGVETAPLSAAQVPPHNHNVVASTDTASGQAASNPSGNYLGVAQGGALNPPFAIYTPATTGAVPLSASTITTAGGGQPHENRQPYLTMVYCICTNGIYPPRP